MLDDFRLVPWGLFLRRRVSRQLHGREGRVEHLRAPGANFVLDGGTGEVNCELKLGCRASDGARDVAAALPLLLPLLLRDDTIAVRVEIAVQLATLEGVVHGGDAHGLDACKLQTHPSTH